MDEQNQFFLNTTPGCQTSSILLKKKQNLSNDPRALMFLALIFLLQLELNSLSGKLELKWMSPWSTSIDTWRVIELVD